MTVSMEPELVRISVLGGSTQLDAGLPAHVPIAAITAELLAALGISDDPHPSGAAVWTLARMDGSRLPPEQTLAESGVLDGDLLLIRPDRPGVRSALVDDVADGVAALLRDARPGWSASASRWIGYAIFLLAVAVAVPVGLGVADAGDRSTVLAVATVCSALTFGIAVSGDRLRLKPDSRTVHAIAATVFGALAAAVAVPGISAAAQTAVAAVVVATLATVNLQGDGNAPAVHTGIATAAVLIAVAGTVAAAAAITVAQVAAVAATLALGLVLLAPRLAITLGGLRLPAVPTLAPDPAADPEPAGVDGIDALAIVDRDRNGEADMNFGDSATLAVRAMRIASILTGLLVGATVVAGVGITAVAATAPHSPVAVVLLTCLIAGVAARGRTHADRRQSTVLVAGAGLAALAAVVVAGLAGTGPTPTTIFLILLAVGVGALVLGTVAAGRTYSPPAVRAAEIAEYAVLVAIVPLLLWFLGIYQLVREL